MVCCLIRRLIQFYQRKSGYRRYILNSQYYNQLVCSAEKVKIRLVTSQVVDVSYSVMALI